jgi:hypothetical protein
MKIVYGLDGDDTIPVVGTTGDNSDPAEDVRSMVADGSPFLVFDSLPAEIEANIAWDPAGAPVCTQDLDDLKTKINDMLANPPLSKVHAA